MPNASDGGLQSSLLEQLIQVRGSYSYAAALESQYFLISRTGHLLREASFPLVISYGIEMIGDWFLHGSNLLKETILLGVTDLGPQITAIGSSSKSLDTHVTLQVAQSRDKALQHVLHVFLTNDSLGKSLALRLLGRFAPMAASRIDVFRIVLQHLDYDSCSESEFRAALLALSDYIDVCPTRFSEMALVEVSKSLDLALTIDRPAIWQLISVCQKLCVNAAARNIINQRLKDIMSKLSPSSTCAGVILTTMTSIALLRVSEIPGHADFLLEIAGKSNPGSPLYATANECLSRFSDKAYSLPEAMVEQFLGLLQSEKGQITTKALSLVKVLTQCNLSSSQRESVLTECKGYLEKQSCPKSLFTVALKFVESTDRSRLVRFESRWSDLLRRACLNDDANGVQTHLRLLSMFPATLHVNIERALQWCSRDETAEHVLKSLNLFCANKQLNDLQFLKPELFLGRSGRFSDRTVCLGLTVLLRHSAETFRPKASLYIDKLIRQTSDLWSLYCFGLELVNEGYGRLSLALWEQVASAVSCPATSARILCLQSFSKAMVEFYMRRPMHALQHLNRSKIYEDARRSYLSSWSSLSVSSDALYRYLTAYCVLCEHSALDGMDDEAADLVAEALRDLARLLMEFPGQGGAAKILPLLAYGCQVYERCSEVTCRFDPGIWLRQRDWNGFLALFKGARLQESDCGVPKILFEQSEPLVSVSLNYSPEWASVRLHEKQQYELAKATTVNRQVQHVFKIEGLLSKRTKRFCFKFAVVVVAVETVGTRFASSVELAAIHLAQDNLASGASVTEKSFKLYKSISDISDGYFGLTFLLNFATFRPGSELLVSVYTFVTDEHEELWRVPNSLIALKVCV